MLKKLATALLICYSGLASAQGTPFIHEADGRLITLTGGTYKSDGSPFLFDDYHTCEMTFQNGKVYKDIKAKLNITENKVYFKDQAGSEYLASAPIKSLKISTPESSEVNIESPGTSINISRAPIYQVLVSDEKVKLLKQIAIPFSESRVYGEGEMTRTFKRRETYSVAFAGQAPQRFEKTKSAVAALFGDKKQQISAYIDEKKLRLKSDADFISVFEYFLTLK